MAEGFTYTLPRIIWSYWHDPNIPPKIKKILDERKEVLSSWEHRVLNEHSVSKYIKDEDFPDGFDDLSNTHKADWIRLYLIHKYGGCWLDATIIFNSPNEIEELYKISMDIQSDLTGYYNPPCLLDKNPRTWIECFFLLAPTNSSLINRWYTEFTRAVQLGFVSYKKDVVSKRTISTCYGEKDDIYFTIYAALQNIILDSDRIYIKDASTSVYKFHYECNWDSECVIDKVKNTPKDFQPNTIKLIRQDRDYL